MISRRLAVVLSCVCVAIPALMYARDIGNSAIPLTFSQARLDARRLLSTTSPGCDRRCGVETLGQPVAHTWRFRLTSGTWRACYDIDPGTFGFNTTVGFIGVKAAPCPLS